MDFIMPFLQDRWYVIIAAIVVLFIVVRIVKTIVKWVIIVAVLAGLWFYGASYKDKLVELGTTAVNSAVSEVKDQAVKAITNEAKEAQYKANPDGSFTISTKSLKLEGKPGTSEVKVTFMNQTFTMKADDMVNALIDQAKKNTKQ
ncbi:hypothetical protein [Paenibacillus thalictri]|uniref:Uncharacterized protein n=1 Tax=Paenibacillus thalictri TaxID=2527873 RepID=A0A4Q9DJJ2_9BACL|nr:hypothetical protein [Paenibacillus thalictri]TBL71550.1 hypothetical protein EYB31_29670 [Paenibacillus thalictri]